MGALIWFEWLPHYRPELHGGERYGVDVSVHQGRIDWSKVERDHIRFAYIKASEGIDFTDARFSTNWNEARAAGLDVGAYHFFTLCTPGADQALNFLAVIGDRQADLAPAVDLELKGNCARRPETSVVRHELDSFLAAVEQRTHHRVVLYVGPEFNQRYGAPRRDLWVRRLYRRPAGHPTYWQVQGRARVVGIRGAVDFDVQSSES